MAEQKSGKHKKWPAILSVIVVLLIAGFSYLFLGAKITDASSEVVKGDLDTNAITWKTRGRFFCPVVWLVQ